MLQDFAIVHRRKPLEFAPGAWPLWSTCLRSLAFTESPEGDVALLPTDEVYQNTDAYRFLLEIVCGLHSPIAGETEVFGQFKNFAAQWTAQEPRRKPLVQTLLNDAKAIRTQHLSGFGTQSYGGWVRKHLNAKRVHVIGGGVLAREILPYLSKNKIEVIMHVREPAKVDFFTGRVCALKERSFDDGALLIAAPVSDAAVAAWLGGRLPEELFDLRETSASSQLRARRQVHGLHEIFAQIEATKSRLQPRLEEVRREIRTRAVRLAERSLLRPQGWDDLCA